MIAIIAVTTLKASLILFGRKAGWSWVHFALGLRAPPQKRIYLSSIMYFEIWYMCLFSFFTVLIMYFEIWYICLFSFFISPHVPYSYMNYPKSAVPLCTTPCSGSVEPKSAASPGAITLVFSRSISG